MGFLQLPNRGTGSCNNTILYGIDATDMLVSRARAISNVTSLKLLLQPCEYVQTYLLAVQPYYPLQLILKSDCQPSPQDFGII